MDDCLLDTDINVRIVADDFVDEAVIAIGVGLEVPLAKSDGDESRSLQDFGVDTMCS